MSKILLVICIILVALSLVARVMIRRRRENHPFVVGIEITDILFLFLGILILGLVNMSMTNQFAKYDEGFPYVNMGGLPADVFIVNMFLFISPLIALGLLRYLKAGFQWLKVIFAEVSSGR